MITESSSRAMAYSRNPLPLQAKFLGISLRPATGIRVSGAAGLEFDTHFDHLNFNSMIRVADSLPKLVRHSALSRAGVEATTRALPPR
jgi:hypothetical protein